jgi:hypothetical protein
MKSEHNIDPGYQRAGFLDMPEEVIEADTNPIQRPLPGPTNVGNSLFDQPVDFFRNLRTSLDYLRTRSILFPGRLMQPLLPGQLATLLLVSFLPSVWSNGLALMVSLSNHGQHRFSASCSPRVHPIKHVSKANTSFSKIAKIQSLKVKKQNIDYNILA